MPAPRILVLYNEPVLPPDHPNYYSESDVLDTADFVAGVLTRAGYRVGKLGITLDPRPLLDALRAEPPDAVFNLYEGTVPHGQNEAYVAGLLEWLGVPFTGCPSPALTLGRNKSLTKYLLQGAGLPTAPFLVVTGEDVPACPFDWPVIVKPGEQDASEGIEQESVVTDQEALRRRVHQMLRAYGPPILVERFVPGREITAALVEDPDLRVLTLSEVLFLDPDPAYWPIVTYDSKWRKNTRDFDATPVRCPADVTPELASRLGELAARAYRLLGCRDVARVDFRVSPAGEPFVLEVNPNPDFNASSGLVIGLTAAGIRHEDFTLTLTERALARGRAAGGKVGS